MARRGSNASHGGGYYHHGKLVEPDAGGMGDGGLVDEARRANPVYRLVESSTFNIVVMVVILVNTACLAVEHYDQPTELTDVLFILNIVFAMMFVIEMVLKLIGLGPRGYVRSAFNVFDGTIVIISVVEIAVDLSGSEAATGLSALRTFRLMRVFKLARSWADLRRLLTTIVKSVADVANASVVLLIIMFIFCLLGMQLFGGSFDNPDDFPDGKPRAHFDNIWWSFVTVFQVLTGENWNEVLYNTVHAAGGVGIAYFVLLNLVGNYLILNLFLAILLGNFDSADEEEELEAEMAGSHAGGGGSRAGSLSGGDDLGGDGAAATGGGGGGRDKSGGAAGGGTTLAGLLGGPSAAGGGTSDKGGAGPAGDGDGLGGPKGLASAAVAPTPTVARVGSASGRDKYLVHGDDGERKEGDRDPMLGKPGNADADAGAGIGTGEAAKSRAWGRGGGGGGGGGGAAAEVDGATALAADGAAPGGGATPAGAPGAGGGRGRGGGGGDMVDEYGEGGEAEERDPNEPEIKKYSLLLFHPDNPIRLGCARLKSHRFFEWFILGLIGLSSILLALDEPRVQTCGKPGGDCETLADFLDVADVVITILFGMEMLIKCVAMGFVWGRTTYLHFGWNVLDFFIVVVSFLSLGLQGGSQLKALRSLRALRALRPLRVVSRYPQLKLVVNSIFGSLPKVRNVALVNLLFFLIFGIVGVQNWMGSFNSCNDERIETKAECVGNFTVTPADGNCHFLPRQEEIDACELDPMGRTFPREWGPPPFHFDNAGSALLTVFEVASGEMWPDIMYVAVDAVGYDEPMQRDNAPAAAVYFIMINVVCAFFMLEIFTGVVIDNFNKMKEEAQGSALLTQEQQLWVETMRMLYGTAPARRMKKPPAKQKLRNRMFAVASSKNFELLIMLFILINSMFLASRHADQTQGFADMLAVVNTIFTWAFAGEAALKIISYGWCQYISVGWNRFDFTLVIGSFLGQLVDLGNLATLLRVVRVARIFRLIRTSKGLLTLFKTLLFSFPSLVNVGTVLILVYFIFAVVGMNLFATIKHGQFLTEDANFESFFVTMITLFRMSTGESYNGIMHDCMLSEPYCDPTEGPNGEEANCGISWFPPIYFITFFVMTAFILLNLLVAIILDNFNDTVAMDNRDDTSSLTDKNMDAFRKVWSEYDPTATRFIPVSKMVNVLLDLEYPLGLRDHPWLRHGVNLRKRAREMLVEMSIPEHEGQVHFHQVLNALAKRACNADRLEMPNNGEVQILTDLQKQESRILRKVLLKEKRNKGVKGSSSQYVSAQLVQSAYRGHRVRKRANTGDAPVRAIGASDGVESPTHDDTMPPSASSAAGSGGGVIGAAGADGGDSGPVDTTGSGGAGAAGTSGGAGGDGERGRGSRPTSGASAAGGGSGSGNDGAGSGVDDMSLPNQAQD